jgi:hypothetical protein
MSPDDMKVAFLPSGTGRYPAPTIATTAPHGLSTAGFGKLRRWADRRKSIVEFHLYWLPRCR